MAQSQVNKQRLSMAGEYGVCSELSKRGYDVSITLGNAKATDILVSRGGNTFSRIEVKTSRATRFVTRFFQKYYNKNQGIHPDFWVLVHIDNNDVSHYYVLTHDEMGNVQMLRNGMTSWGQVIGCDNVLLKHVQQYEKQWHKI